MTKPTTRIQTYRKGVIFREGDVGDAMFVIRSGRVKITKNMYGIMVGIADLGPGDYFGYMAFFEGDRRSATAIAESQVEVEVYDHAALAARISSEPEFAFGLLRAMSFSLRDIDQRLTDLVARGRLRQEEAVEFTQRTACAG